MILTLIVKALLLLFSGIDLIINDIINFVPNVGNIVLAPISVLNVMNTTAYYLKVMAPVTVSLIYSWLFTYFILSIVYLVSVALFSFIPRFKVHY